jgi:hypothetical protein
MAGEEGPVIGDNMQKPASMEHGARAAAAAGIEIITMEVKGHDPCFAHLLLD